MPTKKFSYLICAICAAFCFATTAHAQVSSLNTASPAPEPWTQEQLLPPATLAAQLKANESRALILNIGKVEDIKDATHIGPVSQKENMEKLTKVVSPLARNIEIVIYCGCCPFAKCPNIRPAFEELKLLGFTNIKVLNIPNNLETNWTKEGYPLAGK
ncbi:MAG TPA: rhodanese-like domain-containing protein [Mucilaginibacter sp.]|nr:rhodanese-like domain-containing protein [Mucilaginibacter sp.]